jgi:hypothetical protein
MGGDGFKRVELGRRPFVGRDPSQALLLRDAEGARPMIALLMGPWSTAECVSKQTLILKISKKLLY